MEIKIVVFHRESTNTEKAILVGPVLSRKQEIIGESLHTFSTIFLQFYSKLCLLYDKNLKHLILTKFVTKYIVSFGICNNCPTGQFEALKNAKT